MKKLPLLIIFLLPFTTAAAHAQNGLPDVGSIADVKDTDAQNTKQILKALKGQTAVVRVDRPDDADFFIEYKETADRKTVTGARSAVSSMSIIIETNERLLHSIRQVIELRRAMDLLVSTPHVDKARIGFVGHDLGGMYGMLMAGVDQRPKTYVFIAVTQSLASWMFLGAQPTSKQEYLNRNSVLELTDYLRQVKNASTLFQFGDSDFFVSGADAAVIYAAANQPKERTRYDANHKMDLPQIASDRDSWLVRELGLSPR